MARHLKKLNKKSQIDMTSLYAYADPSHARDRELWRGFLGSVLPVLMPQHAENIDDFILSSLVERVEDLVLKGDFSKAKLPVMRKISAHIAESIGVSAEFALAAFYDSEEDVNLPTKLYKFHNFPVKKHIKDTQEENMIGVWLERFHQVSNEKSFLTDVDTWKDLLL